MSVQRVPSCSVTGWDVHLRVPTLRQPEALALAARSEGCYN